MSKKLMALLLAAVLLLAAGCGKVEDNTPVGQQEDPIVKAYGDDFFLAQAKAMGYTDEMLATAKTMRFDPEKLLTCEGLGDQEETVRTSPDGKYAIRYFYIKSTGHGASVYYLKDEEGTVRVVPWLWRIGSSNELLTYKVDFGFTADGNIWIANYYSVDFYDFDEVWNVSENCALKNSWIAEAAEGRADGYITGIFAVQHDETAGRLVCYWARVPKDWNNVPTGGVPHYRVTVLDETGAVLHDFDTGIEVVEKTSITGFRSLNLPSPKQYSEDGYGFFLVSDGAFGGDIYKINLTTGEVAKTE